VSARGGSYATPLLSSERRRRARNEAANLAECMQAADASGRARFVDRFLWYETRASLSSDQVTAVINRLATSREEAAEVEAHVRYCRTVLSGARAALGPALPIDGLEQALLLLLSNRADERDAAEAWLDGSGRDPAPALARLPGHAFLLLALYRNDCRMSFLARDAFRVALLGEP
jgi:hypothetical protein